MVRLNDSVRYFLIITFFLCCGSSGRAQDAPLKLWYDHPAGDSWESALPLGNGRLAAIVYGNTDKEILQLNESSVWSGGPNRNDNPHALAALPEIRKLLFQDDYAGASALAAQHIQSERINGMEFQPVGNLELNFPGMEQADHYYRDLDLKKAVTTTSFTVKGIRYTREAFVSIADQVIVMRLSADRPGSLNFSAGFSSPQRSTIMTGSRGVENAEMTGGKGGGIGMRINGEERVDDESGGGKGSELILSGISGDKEGVTGQVKFFSALRIRNRGGKLSASAQTLEVSGADEAVLILSIATNFINYHDLSGDEKKLAEGYLDRAAEKGFDALLSRHLQAYQTYFKRVTLDLGTTAASQKPTDERLREFATADDPQLVSLYFQYGRYLLISSSEPGGQPANLQGIWNNKIHPPWGSKYTININTEMNYWPSESTNLGEMHGPLIQMVKDLSHTGRETAKTMYGSGGWVAHHNTDLWRITGPVDGIYSAMWPMGGAWLSEDLWRKYLYSGDKEYLRSVYPALKGAAQFYLDFLIEEPSHHWLVVSPSMSPENNPKISGGKSISAGVTMDNQLLFELFSNVISAAGVLHLDSVLVERLRTARLRLPPMQIGQYGQLQEWLKDLDDPQDKNRHVSHLFGVYPGGQISPYRTPELFSAARTSLLFRGDISTGWSMAWKVNLWARFLDGDHAYQLIRNQLTPAGLNKGSANSGGGTYPNLFDAHPPFQIDGNFGCTAGIAEMLLQCYDGNIFVLPALPRAWKTGRVGGLRAIGGFTITDMEWAAGRLTRLVIRSKLGGNCRIRVGGGVELAGENGVGVGDAVGVNPNPFYHVEKIADPLMHGKPATADAPAGTVGTGALAGTKLYDLETKPGKEYALLSVAENAAGASGHRLTSYVDPMIGAGGHGHVFVGASVPFGAVQVGPNNIPKGWDWCSGYHYSDSLLIGFSQLHLEGTGIGGLGDVLIMPTVGAVRTDKGTQADPQTGYASHYSHADETVRPGYYSVKLADYGIGVELTASERVGFHRYHFPAGKEAHVIVDLKEGTNNKATDTYIEQSDAYTLKGYRFSTGWAKDARVYFAIRSQAPITKFQVYDDSLLLEGGKGRGKAIKGVVSFDQSPGLLQWKVGISPVSADNALANIEAEIPGWDFDGVARLADEKWNKELSKIKIETRGEGKRAGKGSEGHLAWSEENKKIFYTALFHTMIDPALFNDHNGDYRGTDKEVYPHAPFQNYTVFSLWDTYRALNPLYTLIQPERVGDMVNTMLAICRQQGKLPVWHLEGCETNTMPGVSSVQVVAEAYLKGIKGFDPKAAWEAVKQTMMIKDRGLDYDQEDRAIPSDKISESVARGLEYSVSNASVALMARKLGSREDRAYFEKRFHNYGLYYDPVTGFFRGKRADGSWDPVFDPAKSSRPWINDLSEGNHWQYLWLVPEDVEGLIKLQGGDRRFVSRLDSLFSLPVLPDPNAPPDIAGLIGQYAHGDEPGHHTIYLYAYAGQQWKTAEKARYIMKNLYPDNVDGLSGNEDCGQMSAWYVLSALGFYPVFPANGGYVLGSPLFDKATIELPGGKPFTVEAVNNSPENIYIQSVEWNGKPYTKSYILHASILEGGVLRIRMGPKPNVDFGSRAADRPRSVYAGRDIVPVAGSGAGNDARAGSADHGGAALSGPGPGAKESRFMRDFAPSEAIVKAQERPYRDGVCLNGSWKFMPVDGPKPSGADRSGTEGSVMGRSSAGRWDTNLLKHPQIPQNPVWEGMPVKVPSPWNVNSFAGGGKKAETKPDGPAGEGAEGVGGAEEPQGGDFVTYPSYPKKWEGVKAGWLMRKLPYKETWKGKRLILHFDAVAGYVKVFVNKKEAGEHFDNFLPFDLDITDKIDRGRENELLLWVADAGLFNEPGKYGRRIYPGGSFWGQHIIGIWQDVWLSVKPAAYIANSFIEPGVSKDELRAEVTIRNESDVAGKFQVGGDVSPWIDLAGTSVLDAPEPKWKLGSAALEMDGSEVMIAAHTEKKVTLSIKVKGRLALWSPAHPNLYAMMIRVADRRGVLDRQYNRFGWREATIVGNKLYLNGEPVVLKGDSWHFMGIPEMTRRYAWAWYTMLKNAGANTVRLHAEPYPPFFLDMADEMGMMVLDETALWASDGGPKIDGEGYWKNANDHVREFVIRDRNHPSVFGWSVCNENIPVAVNVWHAPETLVERQLSEINRWVATVRALDPSRNWISGDGETGRATELPTIIGHYGDEHAYRDWSSQGKPWGIGESGMAYYGTPRQSAAYNGDASYVSQEDRMKGVAEEATRIINLQKKYKASYMSVFNLVWYGLKPLEFGLSDTGRATEPSDGVFFHAMREGQPGVQPERLGPYTSTLNPGYDPGMPLYRVWPLFDAIKAGFSDSGMVKEHWIGKSREDEDVRNGGAALYTGVRLLSTDKDSVLYSVLRDMGIAVTADGKTGRSRLVVIDGNYPPGDEGSIRMVRSLTGGGGTVLVLGARPSSERVINQYLPDPVRLTGRKASSFIVADQGDAANGDASMKGLSNADLYFSELSRLPLADYGLSGDFVRKGKVLLKDCNTDWKSWNNQPEYKKTITVIRSEREAKPAGNVLVEERVGGRVSGDGAGGSGNAAGAGDGPGREGNGAGGIGAGAGRIYFMTLDPLTFYKTSENVFHRWFENLGLSFAGSGGEMGAGSNEAGRSGEGNGGVRIAGGRNAIDSNGAIRNLQVLGATDGTHILRSSDGGVFELEAGASGVTYLSWWIYSPRSLVNLLAEPDLPVLDLRIMDIGAGREANGEGFRLFLNGKPVGSKALPAEKGWNHFSIRVNQPGRQKLTMKFESDNLNFLREIQSRVMQE